MWEHDGPSAWMYDRPLQCVCENFRGSPFGLLNCWICCPRSWGRRGADSVLIQVKLGQAGAVSISNECWSSDPRSALELVPSGVLAWDDASFTLSQTHLRSPVLGPTEAEKRSGSGESVLGSVGRTQPDVGFRGPLGGLGFQCFQCKTLGLGVWALKIVRKLLSPPMSRTELRLLSCSLSHEVSTRCQGPQICLWLVLEDFEGCDFWALTHGKGFAEEHSGLSFNRIWVLCVLQADHFCT